jgi:CheY-like chemotaxis protein
MQPPSHNPPSPDDESTPVLLLVEDSPEQRMLLREFLSDILPCELHEAPDGSTALAHARRHRPDLVLLDLQIPPHGGMDLLRRLRTEQGLANVPVIVMSGSRLASDLEEVAASGVFRFIEKPYSLDDLEATILEALAEA